MNETLSSSIHAPRSYVAM